MSASALATAAALSLSLALVGCGRPCACPQDRTTPTATSPLDPATSDLLRGHAHNDYEHARPLLDALDAGFCSVEADIWCEEGRITVSHIGIGSRGTLQDLYLAPLQDMVERRGRICGSAPFTLWLDIKDRAPALLPALRELLAHYPMLQAAGSSGDTPEVASAPPVRVVLTGDETQKIRFVRDAPCPALRDSNRFTPDDPDDDAAWRFYALDWSSYVGWDGEGAIEAEDRSRLGCIVASAHAAGRAVRFYDTPETPAFWRLALEAGVDFIGTDDLDALAAFLGGPRP